MSSTYWAKYDVDGKVIVWCPKFWNPVKPKDYDQVVQIITTCLESVSIEERKAYGIKHAAYLKDMYFKEGDSANALFIFDLTRTTINTTGTNEKNLLEAAKKAYDELWKFLDEQRKNEVKSGDHYATKLA